MPLYETVRAVVARTFQLPLESITAETGYGSPEAWDSMGHLMLMMELESTLNVRFSTEQISRPRTLGQLLRVINEVLPNERYAAETSP